MFRSVPRPLRQAPLRLAIHSALSLLPLLAVPIATANAQAAPAPGVQHYALPAGPLAPLLTRFAAQSGLHIAADAHLTSDRRSPGLRGDYTPAQGLEQLLTGTGLGVTWDAGGAAVLRTAAGGGVQSIGVLRVPGAELRHATSDPVGSVDQVFRDPTGSVYIPHETLERFRGQSVGDILAGTVGVHTADVRNGGAIDVNIRGLQGQGRVPVVIDGGQQSIDVYRGYAGVQQRSYLDPDLISSVSISKGPTLAANAASAIGGVVSMETLTPADILREGQDIGVRLRGGIASNSIAPGHSFKQIARGSDHRNSLASPEDRSGSLALAIQRDRYDIVAAYAKRTQGNYFAGERDVARYDRQHLSAAGTGMSSLPVTAIFHGGDEVLNTHTDNTSALLKLTWRPSDDQRLEAGYRYFDSSFGEIMPSAIGRVGESNQWVTYVDKANTMHQFEPGRMRINAFSLRHRYQPQGHPLVDLKSTLWFTSATSRMFNSNVANTPLFKEYPGDAMPDTLGETYGPGLRSDVRSDRWGLDATNTSRQFTDLGDVTWTYGLAFQHEDTAPDSPVLAVDYNNNRYLRSGVRREASAVASLEWAPADWLSLTVGGRYIDYRSRDRNRIALVAASRTQPYTFARLSKDGTLLPGWYKEWFPDASGQYTFDSLRASPYGDRTLGEVYDFDGYIPDPRGSKGFYTKQIATAWNYAAPFTRSGHGATPYVNASLFLDPDTFFYVKYAQGYKMPGLFESTVGNSTSMPTRDLRPEKNRAWDIGVSTLKRDLWRDGDRFAFKLAYFRNDVNDQITRVFDAKNWGYSVVNVDRYLVSGYELQSGYDIGVAYLDLSASYYQRARTCDAATAATLRNDPYAKWSKLENTPDCVNGGFGTSFVNAQNPPKYSVYTTLGVRLFDRRLDAGIRRIYNAGPTHELDKPWNTTGSTGMQNLYLPAALYDLYASYRVDERLSMELVINNVRDTYYLDPLAMSLMPGPGRTARLNLSLRF
jgi:hemoglobin/transferrin/lactoferrin receptor protein